MHGEFIQSKPNILKWFPIFASEMQSELTVLPKSRTEFIHAKIVYIIQFGKPMLDAFFHF